MTLDLGAAAPRRRADSEVLSVVVPVYNEQENIGPLCVALDDVIRATGRPYEIILVNDGSSDRSRDEIAKAATTYPHLVGINLRRNYGQTAALMAGIDRACGEVIVFIDADLQNDPKDIPRLLAKLDEGYDVVSGWRRERKDAALRRNFVSRVANVLISWISGVHLHDYGCTLKAYRRSVIKGMRLYGEMHRFLPIYATWMGATVCEIPVQHNPRRFGVSKYGLNRIFKVTPRRDPGADLFRIATASDLSGPRRHRRRQGLLRCAASRAFSGGATATTLPPWYAPKSIAGRTTRAYMPTRRCRCSLASGG
jgi:glycosyltransferase involved in cell wall biosynthesis